MTTLAALFPGQGSQYVGMGQRYLEDGTGRELYHRVDAALGFSLSELSLTGPQAELTLTANAQPALVTHSYVSLRALHQKPNLGAPVEWAAAAGHSLGEWSAYLAAGVFTLEDAARLVHLRGQLMQKAVPAGVGAMSALIGLDARVVEDLCKDAAMNEVVAPATYNGRGQIVVSGHATAVARAEALAVEAGALKVSRLDVSAPFHSRLMEPAIEPLRAALDATMMQPASFPVCSTVDLSWPTEPSEIRRVLVEQLVEPTRWAEAVDAVVASGVEELHVIGASTSLARTVKRLRTGAKVVAHTEECLA
jgi:[acyl-carrier-protein] S-malonyltransferase